MRVGNEQATIKMSQIKNRKHYLPTKIDTRRADECSSEEVFC